METLIGRGIGYSTSLSPNTKIVQTGQTTQSVIDSCPSPAVDNLFEVLVPDNRRDESWIDTSYVTVVTLGHAAKLPVYADANAAIKGGLACNRFYQASETVKVVPEKVLIMKDADADQSIDIILSLPAGKSLLIEHGDTGANTTTVNGPESVVTHTINYGDADAHETLISGDLASITYFKITSEPISKIYNLRRMTSLTHLYLHSNALTDVGDLSNLTLLTNLILRDNSLTDVGDLSNLTALISVRFSSNLLTDIGNLSKLISLDTLQLNNNSFSQVELSDYIDQMWDNRVALRALSCAIKIEDNDSTPSCDADAVAKIEGTGDYAGDGLKDGTPGCTVTYDA